LGVISEQQIPWFAEADQARPWLVGVSGGADSLALLHLLLEHGFSKVVVCHLDHGLRGEASVGDAEFVRVVAEKLGVVCELGFADVAERVARGEGSVETVARKARHEFFADCARRHPGAELVLAHHADDQAETVLWNLLRGSHGLRGMRSGHALRVAVGLSLVVHRPLLGLRRGELREFLSSRGHEWREDASNAEPVAIRNRLRNEGLPVLSEISGRDAAQALVRAAADAEGQAALEAWAVAQANALDPQGRVHVRVLRELPRAVQQAVLASFLKSAGIGSPERDLISRVLGLLEPSAAPAVNLPGGGWVRRREARLVIEGRSGSF
jgi:tRNA(Ile)-lysidine synthase